MTKTNKIINTLIIISLVTGLLMAIGTGAFKKPLGAKGYTQVGTWIVDPGDTLSDIAMSVNNGKVNDIRDVIQELYALNAGLTPNLQIGQEIVTPIYDTNKE